MQLYDSFVRPGNLRLKVIPGTGHLFRSVLVQHLMRRRPQQGLCGAIADLE